MIIRFQRSANPEEQRPRVGEQRRKSSACGQKKQQNKMSMVHGGHERDVQEGERVKRHERGIAARAAVHRVLHEHGPATDRVKREQDVRVIQGLTYTVMGHVRHAKAWPWATRPVGIMRKCRSVHSS